MPGLKKRQALKQANSRIEISSFRNGIIISRELKNNLDELIVK